MLLTSPKRWINIQRIIVLSSPECRAVSSTPKTPAKTTGAEAIVTACPWCERNFIDAISKNGDKIKVYDIVELVQQAI